MHKKHNSIDLCIVVLRGLTAPRLKQLPGHLLGRFGSVCGDNVGCCFDRRLEKWLTSNWRTVWDYRGINAFYTCRSPHFTPPVLFQNRKCADTSHYRISLWVLMPKKSQNEYADVIKRFSAKMWFVVRYADFYRDKHWLLISKQLM